MSNPQQKYTTNIQSNITACQWYTPKMGPFFNCRGLHVDLQLTVLEPLEGLVVVVVVVYLRIASSSCS